MHLFLILVIEVLQNDFLGLFNDFIASMHLQILELIKPSKSLKTYSVVLALAKFAEDAKLVLDVKKGFKG